jgi:hypothetical protein
MNTPVGFVGRQSELRILGDRLPAARKGNPQVVYLEDEAGAGKSTLQPRFLRSPPDAVVLQVGGDEAETLLSYGIFDQLQPGASSEPGPDPMAAGARLLDLLDLLDRLQAGRCLRADKVLAVVSTRAGGLADPGWARFVGGDGRVTRMRLGGLSPADLTELAGALGLGALSQRRASRLTARRDSRPQR